MPVVFSQRNRKKQRTSDLPRAKSPLLFANANESRLRKGVVRGIYEVAPYFGRRKRLNYFRNGFLVACGLGQGLVWCVLPLVLTSRGGKAGRLAGRIARGKGERDAEEIKRERKSMIKEFVASKKHKVVDFSILDKAGRDGRPHREKGVRAVELFSKLGRAVRILGYTKPTKAPSVLSHNRIWYIG